MPSFCYCAIMGHLTKDPDYRHTHAGSAVCELNVAFNRKGRNGQEEVTYMDVIVWGKTADNCKQYLYKGSCVHVTGYLKQERWQDNNGNNRSKIKLVSENLIFMPSGKGVSETRNAEHVVSPEYGPERQENTQPPRRSRFYGDPGVVSEVPASDSQYEDQEVPF